MISYAISIKYMIAGYSVIFIILAVYLLSLVARWRKIKRDLQILENINERVQKESK